MKVFLTGGTGFIGQQLTKTLIARSWEVVVLVRKRDSPQAQALTRMGANCVAGDVTDRETMRTDMTDSDIVIHNAAWYELGVAKNLHKRMHDINVTGTENVLSLAQELAVPRIVYVSSTTYYGDTGSEIRDETYSRQAPYYFYYEQTKTEAHERALQYQQQGLPLVIVCPTHVVGANDHSVYGYFQRLYVNRLMPPIGWAPNTIHSPVHVNDVAEGIALAAEKGHMGENYVLSGDATSLREIFQIWATNPGGFSVRFFVPFWLVSLMFAPIESVQRWLGLPAFMSRETVVASKGSLAFSSAKAQQELGWTYRPAKELWSLILADEQQLIADRPTQGIISRLNPLETIY